jgi:outer membrane protein TolC
MFRAVRLALIILGPVVLAGCTIHPEGEKEERQSALKEGKSFTSSDLPPIPENPTEDQLVSRALHASAELQQRYWEWRAAIEQVPQDGTQATNIALSAGVNITNGALSRDNTTLGVSNDPMADIVLPPKLSTAARRALENAKASGLRFRKAQFELRSKVLSAYADYAITAELIRLEEANSLLLSTAVTAVEARNAAGVGGQQDLLRMKNELDLSQNDLANLRSTLPGELAALNAILDRKADAAIATPTALWAQRSITQDDKSVLRIAAERNPELLALTREESADAAAIKLAKLQYLPDVSLSANTDLAGITQSLAGMVTVPLLRYEAINAAIAQAEATVRAKEAERRQIGDDLAAELVADLSGIHDADRQLHLFDNTILPRARQAETVTRASYEAGQATLLDLLDAQRSLIAIERMRATLWANRTKAVLRVEAIVALPMEENTAREASWSDAGVQR